MPQNEFAEEEERYIFPVEPMSQNDQLLETNPTILSEEQDVHIYPQASTSAYPPESQNNPTTNDSDDATNIKLSLSTTPARPNHANCSASTSAQPSEYQTKLDIDTFTQATGGQPYVSPKK